MDKLRSEPSQQSASGGLFVLTGIILLGLLLRVLQLMVSGFGIESDEAIVGLMAKHISEGKDWPIFYYGQHYMGSLEAILTAGVFSLFGVSTASLKIVPLLFSLLHIATVYALASRFCEKKYALIAALLTAVAPSTLVLWSSKARGGFIELVMLGTLSLLLTYEVMVAARLESMKIAALGFLLGVGWWVNNQVAYYMAPIGLLLLLVLPRSLGLRAATKGFFIGLFSFFLGGLPFWYANIFLEPQWATFDVLFGGSSEVDTLAHFQGFVFQALPILLGARRFWSDTDVFPNASALAYVVYGGVFLLVLLTILRPRVFSASTQNTELRKSQLGLTLLLLFVVSTAFIFSRSSFGWLSRAPRYLLPLYSVLPVLVAVSLARLFALRNLLGLFLGTGLFLSVLGLNLASNYLGGLAKPGQPSVFRGQRVSDSHEELYRWLEQRGYEHIATNYWIGYRAAFETAEKIRFTRLGRPRSLRISAYESGVPQAVVLVPAEAALYERELRQFGFRYQRSLVSGYVVLDSIEREYPLGRELPRSVFEIQASAQPELIEKMFDEDLDTRWGSGSPQAPNMLLLVNFSHETLLSGLTLDFGRFVHDAPRRLRVEGQNAVGDWFEIADFSETKIFYDLREGEFAEIPSTWQISFKPLKLTALRLLQLESTAVFDWSLAELRLHGEAKSSEASNLGE